MIIIYNLFFFKSFFPLEKIKIYNKNVFAALGTSPCHYLQLCSYLPTMVRESSLTRHAPVRGFTLLKLFWCLATGRT